MKPITHREYARRVFNECLLEGFNKLHRDVISAETIPTDKESLVEQTVAANLCRNFFTDILDLNHSTIEMTKKRLSESTTYIKRLVALSESIAKEKSECADDECLEMDDEQKAELSDEDKELLDKMHDDDEPDVQVDAIRDATVKALIAEDKKSQEIKDSITIAQSQSETDKDTAALKETVDRLNKRGPTSLMNAILNNVAVTAVNDVTKNGKLTSVATVMSENATMIKNRATEIYTLYEMSSVFGIKKYSRKELQDLCNRIYYNK